MIAEDYIQQQQLYKLNKEVAKAGSIHSRWRSLEKGNQGMSEDLLQPPKHQKREQKSRMDNKQAAGQNINIRRHYKLPSKKILAATLDVEELKTQKTAGGAMKKS